MNFRVLLQDYLISNPLAERMEISPSSQEINTLN